MWMCLQASSIIYGFIYEDNYDKCILIIIIIIKFFILTEKIKEKKFLLYIKLFYALYGLSTSFNYYG